MAAISRKKVLPSDECTLSVCLAHMQQCPRDSYYMLLYQIFAKFRTYKM